MLFICQTVKNTKQSGTNLMLWVVVSFSREVSLFPLAGSQGGSRFLCLLGTDTDSELSVLGGLVYFWLPPVFSCSLCDPNRGFVRTPPLWKALSPLFVSSTLWGWGQLLAASALQLSLVETAVTWGKCRPGGRLVSGLLFSVLSPPRLTALELFRAAVPPNRCAPHRLQHLLRALSRWWV